MMCNAHFTHAAASSFSRRWCCRRRLAFELKCTVLQTERSVLERVNAALEANKPARSLTLKPEEAAAIKALDLLTAKPMIYAANVAEGDLADQGASCRHVQAMRARADQEGSSLVICSAQVRVWLPWCCAHCRQGQLVRAVGLHV